jgi:hypothetical protein
MNDRPAARGNAPGPGSRGSAPGPGPSLAFAIALAAAAGAAAYAARHGAIEPAAIAHACDPDPWRGACAARTLLIHLIAGSWFGWIAVLAGGWATLSRSRRWAALALAAGAAGLVLYAPEPAAVGGLLGALVLARGQAKAASTSISDA